MDLRRKEVSKSPGDMWAELLRAESAFYRARQQYVQSRGDSTEEIRQALQDPAQRGTALRLLRVLPEDVARQVFADVLDAASFASGDIVAAREVIRSMDRAWLHKSLPPQIDRVLNPQTASDEEFRRLAELLNDVAPDLLPSLIERARFNANPDIQEVARDFSGR